MVKSEVNSNIKVIGNATYEIIPTESGYGYLICVALSIVIIVLYSYYNSIGLLFNDFLEDIGAGVGGLTLAIGVNNSFMSFSGILTNIALKKFTLRQVGLFGAILYTTGWFLTSFVQSMPQMIITFGCMIGISSGILYTAAFASFGTYFVSHKKVTVMSFCQIFISSSSMLLPLLMEKMLKEYGYRGTILIMSAFMAHSIFAVASMHPVEWHSKKRLLYKTIDTLDEIKLEKNVEKSYETIAKFTVKKVDDGLLEDLDVTQKNTGKLAYILEFLDLTLLKDIVFVNMMFGLTLGLMVDVFFFSIFPSHLYDLGFETEKIAILLSVLGGADLGGRAFLVVFSKYCKARSELIFYYGILFTTFFRLFFFFCQTYRTFLLITIILGFLRALIQCPYALVYADYDPKKFPAALALGMLTYGSISLPLLLLIGSLHDNTGSHVIGYSILTLSNVIFIITWTIKLWHFRKNRINET